MEKLDKHQSRAFGPVSLGTRAVAAILEQLKDRSSLELIADDVKYESVQELVDDRINSRVKYLLVNARNPYFSLDLKPHETRLFIGSSSLEAVGLFERVSKLLRDCELRPRLAYRYDLVFLISLVAPNMLLLPVLAPYAFLRIYISLLLLAWMIWLIYIKINRHSFVYIGPMSREPGFYGRNKDAIIVGTITGLIGAIAGSVLTRTLEAPRSQMQSPENPARSVAPRDNTQSHNPK
jgi:hypothetical protein